MEEIDEIDEIDEILKNLVGHRRLISSPIYRDIDNAVEFLVGTIAWNLVRGPMSDSFKARICDFIFPMPTEPWGFKQPPL